MNKIPGAINLGLRRGTLEIKQFTRQRESVVFTILFPLQWSAITVLSNVFEELLCQLQVISLENVFWFSLA